MYDICFNNLCFNMRDMFYPHKNKKRTIPFHVCAQCKTMMYYYSLNVHKMMIERDKTIIFKP